MKIENRNYDKGIKEHKDPFGIFGIIAIVFFVALTAYVLISEYSKENDVETVSIHRHNALQLRIKYLFMENQVKNQLLFDLAVEGETDSVFVLSIINHVPEFLLNPTDGNIKVDDIVKKELKELMAFQLDSICADWYESIPFMFIDAEHDSTWVLNSESYQRTMLIVNDLRNKWR